MAAEACSRPEPRAPGRNRAVNIAASAFWAYAERIGAVTGMSEGGISNTLTFCNLFSMTGSMLAYWLGRRWGQYRPHMAAIAIMITVYLMWWVHLTTAGYIGGVLVFFNVWSVATVFQLNTLTALDPSGRRVALIPAAQGVGQSVGPFLAAFLLGWGLIFPQMLATVTVFTCACLAANGNVFWRLRRSDPQAALA